MKTIIAGSRTITDYTLVCAAIQQSGIEITEVFSGSASGVDRLGERYARERNLPCQKFPAKWDTHGKGAGYRRNFEMAKQADALIAIWDGKSKGTEHMIETMEKFGHKVYIMVID